MTRPLKVLILEDLESDAELMVHELKRAGFQPDWMRVDTENQYLAALGSDLDLILADYNLPQFDAFLALQLMQEWKLDIPFIVISGAMTEDAAVEFMKQGASDYLLKDRLARLGQAAVKALEQRELREEKRRAKETLRREYERRKDLEDIVNRSPIVIFLWRNELGWPVEMVSENVKIFGYSADDFISERIHYADIIHPDDLRRIENEVCQHTVQGDSEFVQNYRIITKDGQIRWVDDRTTVRQSPSGERTHYQGIIMDITSRMQTEEALRKEKEFADGLINTAQAIILVLDTQGRIAMMNPYMEEISGYRLEEVRGKDWFETFLPESDRQRIRELFSRAISDVRTKGNINPIVAKDGREIIVEWYDKLLLDPSGKVTGLLSIGQDITERKKTEEEVRESEKKYRLLIDNANESIIVAQDDRLKFVNSMTLGLFGGYSEQELIDRPFAEFIHPDDRSMVVENYRRRIANEAVRPRYTVRVVTRDGIVKWVEINATLIEWQGKPATLIFLTDITERKQAEEALRESEEKWRSLVSVLPDYVSLLDREGRFLFLNHYAEGFTEKEVIGSSICQYLSTQSKEIFRKEIAECQNARKIRKFEHTAMGDHGIMRVYEDYLVPILENNKAARTLVISRDITERKRAEEALVRKSEDLARSNAELAQFAYVASHDLKEPLRMVTSYVQLLEERYKGKLDPDADEFIGYAVEGTKRMRQLLNALLNYSGVSTRGNPLQTVESETVLETALQNLKIVLEETKGTVTHDPLPVIIADETQMVQLFQNLIGNGLKFHGPQPPLIHVSAKQEGTNWIFSFQDNGIGIDPQYFEKIFVIFQRLHTRDKYPGLGIGLAIAKKIVEQHGGRIWAESEKEKGSAFYFTIPVDGFEEGKNI